ncbi:hypothetical protein [Stappia sp. ES.058]|uniref:hypothetical protein n=1 Tax=Stappia sp. ES.058 TaxID=1881061 RepID=UPI000879DEE8|nr:hypothetical protein [Stappia sp. ES.058]SDU25764.1 hypothetical protein SAMN05428979_2581 [Stappia sp. ES.058]
MPGSVQLFQSPVPANIKRPGVVFFLILISTVVLFAAEIAVMALGTIWALSGFLALGPIGTAAVAAPLVPAALYCIAKLAVMAYEGEYDLLSDEPTDA